MPSMKDIRKRISSTKNTQQITKAMKMVSAAKLRRSQQAIVAARPYAYKVQSVIHHLSQGGVSHPLMEQVAVPKKLLLVVLTSDRGLCGSFNGSVLKFTERFHKANLNKYEKIGFIFLGRRGNDFFKKRGVEAVETITNLINDVRYDLAAKLADKVMAEFTSGGYDEVVFIYNEFKSAISQKIVAEKIVPVNVDSATSAFEGANLSSGVEAIAASATPSGTTLDYIFEPGSDDILNQLIPKHIAIQVYRTMLESIASEHGARMSAMDSATRNAGEMIKKLTLTYNKLRQAAITKELMEIVSGAEALK